MMHISFAWQYIRQGWVCEVWVLGAMKECKQLWETKK